VPPALGAPAWAGGWAGGSPEGPVNPCHAGMLGFCDMKATYRSNGFGNKQQNSKDFTSNFI